MKYKVNCPVFGYAEKKGMLVPEWDFGDLKSYEYRDDPKKDMYYILGTYETIIDVSAEREITNVFSEKFKCADFGEMKDYYRSALKAEPLKAKSSEIER